MSSHSGLKYEVTDLGLLQTKQIPQNRLYVSGEGGREGGGG